MPKGDRKRSNSGKRDTATGKIDRSDATPLKQNEAYLFKELIDQSNVYGKLMKQYEEIEFVYQNLLWKRKQIQKGEIEISKTSPIYVTLVGSSLIPLTDKKQVIKDIDEQLKGLKLQRDGVKGQLLHRRDEYIESALRLKTFLEGRYGKYTTKSIGVAKDGTGVRVSAGREKQKKEEQTLFEAEFNDLMKDSELQKEFKEKLDQAKAENKEMEK